MSTETETTDIFHWANRIDAIKRELDFEIFLFNKRYTPYSTTLSNTINRDHVVLPLFVYELVSDVLLGAGKGMQVVDIAYAENDAMALRRADLNKVGRAETLIHLIENERSDIVQFSNEEHDFKRIKGIIARFTHRESGETFYIVKQAQQSATLTGVAAWSMVEGGKIRALQEDIAFKLPPENHVLIVNKDIFAFSPSKFEQLFEYDARKIAVVEQKGKEIEEQFKLSYPGTIGLDFAYMVRQSKTLINKMQTVDPLRFRQEDVIQLIDDMALELMVDDEGKIIIMEEKDLSQFLSIINDDYVRGIGTDVQYIAKTKKMIEEG